MSIRRILVYSFFVYYLSLSSSEASPLGLKDCFQAAIKRSEDIATSQESVVQAEEMLTQAKGAFFPTISGSAAYLVQANPTTATGVSISPPNQTTVKLTATQPLFQGLKEYAALRQQKDLYGVSEDNKQQAITGVFQSLVTSYYQVLSLAQDLKNLNNEIDYNQKRLKELHYFQKLGRSRESEVLTLQSNIASLEAQVEGSSGQLDNAKAVFAYLTGLDPNTPLYDSEGMPNRSDTLQQYLARIDSRPDVQSLMKSVLATEEGISIARGGHLPTVGLLGDYYFARPGLLSEVNWDFQISLTMPIFQGGIIQAQVRQAASVNKQSQLALSKARRLAEQQIESYYKLYQSDFSQLQKQKVAVDLAMKNYQAELRDYRLGLVTNLDVLQALTTSQESQRLLDRAQFQLKSDYLQLQAAAALVPNLPSKN